MTAASPAGPRGRAALPVAPPVACGSRQWRELWGRRPPHRLRIVRGLLVAVLAAGLAAGAGAPRALATPVRTALASAGGDGAWRFLSDLGELWRNRYEPTDEGLAVRVVNGAEERLRAVNRGRGDFAVVDVATAAARLADYPNLTALAVLWPSVLQAFTRNPAVRELRTPVAAELWVFDSADFAAQTLRELARNDAAQTALVQRMPDDLLMDALDYAREPIVLLAAPAPLREVSVAMARDGRLQMLPIAGKLVDDLRQARPWLVTQKIGRGIYSGQDRNLELPAVFQVLIGRRDLPAPTARKVLDTVYGRSSAMGLFDPLFGQTDGTMNAVFGKLLPFHPETARRFSFTPALP